MNQNYILILAVLGMFILTSCTPNTSQGKIEMPMNEEGNFILYVSDQSREISPVDIRIYIDGKLAIDDNFDVTGNRTPQHNWKKFQFQLEKGNHTIKATSQKGDTILEKNFEIIDKHWAVIDYWYYSKVSGGAGPEPKHFIFNIQDKPIGFK